MTIVLIHNSIQMSEKLFFGYVEREMIGKLSVILLVVVFGWAYHQAIQPPPPPNICGSPNDPTTITTSSRVQLSDGRHIAYRETGVPKEKAKYKIILVHGFAATKDQILPASPELVEELGLYMLSFDRAGYADSDPNPKRSVKSDAMDIQELADRVQLGQKFYLIGTSMGAYPTWGCLKYMPHRLAGVALVVPAINYWWPSFPREVSSKGFNRLPLQDQATFMIARHTPWLLYPWMTQLKFLPTASIVQGDPAVLFNQHDLEIIQNTTTDNSLRVKCEAQKQGKHESLYRDVMVLMGRWEFDPMEDLTNPFGGKGNVEEEEEEGSSSVHIWQGGEDRIVPVELQRYVSNKLAWIKYHECQECGHLFVLLSDWTDRVLKALLLGE